MTPIPDYPIDAEIEVPEQGTWPSSVHLFKEETVAALQAAEATGRPLLIRGLPGVGKSETARAAAAYAKRPFLAVVIDGRTEPDDLKWRMDAVRRLSDAQAKKVKAELNYVRPEALWWAYDWRGACQQAETCGIPAPEVKAGAQWKPEEDRVVLLLDEVDKADPDLPNALLEVLANKGFVPPFPGAPAIRCTDATRPLVIITTNEERELPSAFLRRCLVLRLALPKEEQELREELLRLGQHHVKLQKTVDGSDAVSPTMLGEILDEFLKVRQRSPAGEYTPGTSEYLDLVRALGRLYPGDDATQRARLALMSRFVDKTLSDRG